MKHGLGIVTCGVCRHSTVVAWMGQKYKMPCPTCKNTMSIHRQRLKKFQTLEEKKRG